MRRISQAVALIILTIPIFARAESDIPTDCQVAQVGDITVCIQHRRRIVFQLQTTENYAANYAKLAGELTELAKDYATATLAPSGDRGSLTLSNLPGDAALGEKTALGKGVTKIEDKFRAKGSDVSAISTGADDYFVIRAYLPNGRTDANTRVTVHVPDGTYWDLIANAWLYATAMPSLIQVTIEEEPTGLAGPKAKCGESDVEYKEHVPSSTASVAERNCTYSFVLARTTKIVQEAAPGHTEAAQPNATAPAAPTNVDVIVALEERLNGLVVNDSLWNEIDEAAANTTTEYSINGVVLVGRKKNQKAPPPRRFFFFPPGPDGWKIEAIPIDLHICRRYPKSDDPASDDPTIINIPRPIVRYALERAKYARVDADHANDTAFYAERGNGITVGAPKIYDTLALQRMLTDTAVRLGALAGFDSASIIGALGNIQGISRDTSNFSAQIAALPTASTVVNALTSSGGNNTTTTSGAVPTTSNSTVTIQCPDGSLPTAGAAFGCTAPSNPPATALPNLSGQMTTNGTSTVGPSTQQVAGTTTSQQLGTTTTSGGNSGLSYIPVAPTLNPLSVSNSVGLSSSDVLTQQVELNAQITSLRLLLQGALSDQFLVKDARAIANRQQTTLGISVSLDPPKQYKHAVAEVRVVISPPPGQDGVSIMNLLPAEKTYNVAKVTSNATQFGAGVVTSAIGIGVNGGTSRDRLYLVKDTDTVALQFPRPGTPAVGRAFPRRAADAFRTALDFESRGSCDDDELTRLPYPGNVEEEEGGTVVFGWQFRPVLGQDYVTVGQRQVFVQLALPASTDAQYIPSIHVQTRWRAYDPKRQVVGTVYKRTCSWTEEQGGIVLLNRPEIRDVHVADLGGGNVKIAAHGDFFSSGVHIVAGVTSYLPSFFDGSDVKFVGKASDFVGADEIDLIGANGQSWPFAIPINGANENDCGISQAKLVAMPNADGNSRMRLTLTMGPKFGVRSKSRAPGDPVRDDPNPMVLIGSQVYGLRETPFFKYPSSSPSACEIKGGDDVCTYRFLAPTTDIRNAQRFTVSDIAWSNVRSTGKIAFLPSLSAMAKAPWAKKASPNPDSCPDSATGDGSKPKDPNAPPPKPGDTTKCSSASKPSEPVEYSISGFNLSALKPCRADFHANEGELCVKTTPAGIFEVNSDSVATLRLDPKSKDASGVRFELSDNRPTDCHGSSDCTDWERRAVWDFKVPKDESTPSLAAVQVHVGDSEQITFADPDKKLTGIASVSFEGVQLPFLYDSNKNSLSVNIISQVTRRAGHKDLIATDPKQLKPIELPVDVL